MTKLYKYRFYPRCKYSRLLPATTINVAYLPTVLEHHTYLECKFKFIFVTYSCEKKLEKQDIKNNTILLS